MKQRLKDKGFCQRYRKPLQTTKQFQKEGETWLMNYHEYLVNPGQLWEAKDSINSIIDLRF